MSADDMFLDLTFLEADLEDIRRWADKVYDGDLRLAICDLVSRDAISKTWDWLVDELCEEDVDASALERHRSSLHNLFAVRRRLGLSTDVLKRTGDPVFDAKIDAATQAG